MRNDASIHVTRDLTITVHTSHGETVVRLTRLNAQVFASTLRAYSGSPSKGIELNAGKFSTVYGDAVVEEAKVLPIVQLRPSRRSAARTK